MRPVPFRPALFVAVFSIAVACHDDDDEDDVPQELETAAFTSDVATQWFDQLYVAVRAESLSPPVASRRIGYAGVALYEAVVGGMPEHHSLAGQLNGLDALPERPTNSLYWPAVANAAMGSVLEGLFAGGNVNTLNDIAALEQNLSDSFDGAADANTLQRSEAFGEDLATAVLAWAATDGFAQWNNCAYTPPTGAGAWEPTPPAFLAPLQPCWGNLRPFALLFAAECVPLAFPTYSEDVGSAFYVEALEVRDTVDALSPEELEIARFWADSPGATGTPPGHWISIVGQVCTQENANLGVAAEAYARVGIAVADAFIACWELKYHFNLLRPITYIQDAAGPINDPTWTSAPGVGTPNFPEFPSGHSVQSGAAALVLRDLLGDVAFTDHTHDGAGLPARSFTSFTEAASEAAISRLYGGIHFRAAIDRGLEQGFCIAATILDNVEFRRP
jgi:hypothetical protein